MDEEDGRTGTLARQIGPSDALLDASSISLRASASFRIQTSDSQFKRNPTKLSCAGRIHVTPPQVANRGKS